MGEMTLRMIRPPYDIGQLIYVPEAGGAVETKVIAYEVQVMADGTGLAGIVSAYRTPQMVFLRRGAQEDLVNRLKHNDFYADITLAKEASRFISVNLDDETWKLAIGDREVKDESSPYFIDNSCLLPCCANISEARDILLYCKKNSGLIVHNRDELSSIISGHGLAYAKEGPLGKILKMLEIEQRRSGSRQVF